MLFPVLSKVSWICEFEVDELLRAARSMVEALMTGLLSRCFALFGLGGSTWDDSGLSSCGVDGFLLPGSTAALL